jgi:hypothetical protein
LHASIADVRTSRVRQRFDNRAKCREIGAQCEP